MLSKKNKTIYIALIFMITLNLMLSSCKKQPTYKGEAPIGIEFSADIYAKYDGMDIEAKLNRSYIGMLTLEVLQPDTIAGTSMVWDGRDITISYGGMSFVVNGSEFPQAALGTAIISVLDDAVSLAPNLGELTDAGRVISGENDHGSYTLISDPDTGNLISLEIPERKLSVRFDNFQIKK